MLPAARPTLRIDESSPPTAAGGRFQAGQVLITAAAHAVHDMYTAFLAPLLPHFIAVLALSKTQAGTLTVFLQFPSLLQPAIGHVADRYALRALVILAPAAVGILMSLLGVASSYLMLAFLLTLAGLVSAGLHSVGPVMVGRQSGAALGRGMSLWMVGGELGRTVGPLLIVSVVGKSGVQDTSWLMIFGLLASAALYVVLRRGPDSGATVRLEQSLPIRTALRGMGPFLIPLALVLALPMLLNVALTTYLPTFLTEEGDSLQLAGVALAILQAAGVVGALLGGSISDRIGRRPLLAGAMLAAPVLLLIFLAVQGTARLPLLILMGFFTLAMTPVIMALVQESYPENRALANGIYMALSFTIRSGAVIVLGLLADGLGMRAAFTISAGLALLGVPAVALLPGRNGGRRR